MHIIIDFAKRLLFQCMRPVWGATTSADARMFSNAISIYAPLNGRYPMDIRLEYMSAPLTRGNYDTDMIVIHQTGFQYTRPTRGATSVQESV